MITKFKLNDFLELAKKKREITWSEIESFFGDGFIETEEFDKILYKLYEEKVKVINDFINKDSINNKEDTLLFKSYIDFDTPESIARREEIGGKKSLNPTNDFKEYLINAYLIMNYEIENISGIYGVSIEILQDWIFAYMNKYEVIVPHCYVSTERDIEFLYLFNNYYKKHNYVNANKFFIDFYYEIPESIRINFNKVFKDKSKSDAEIALSLRIYPSLVKKLKTDLKKHAKKDYFYKSVIKKIPMWAHNPNQYNHRIIRAYFKAYHRFDEPPTKDMMREICSTDPTCYVDNFQSTYASLKSDGSNTNGKVFIDDGTYVQIWEEVEDVLLKFEKYFYNNEEDK